MLILYIGTHSNKFYVDPIGFSIQTVILYANKNSFTSVVYISLRYSFQPSVPTCCFRISFCQAENLSEAS